MVNADPGVTRKLSRTRPAATVEQIEAHVADGAPTNADATIKLMRYAACLVKEMAARAD